MNITDENFEEEVIKSDKLVMVDFYADWCGPCKMMSPIVEKLANEVEDVKVVKVNVDNAQQAAQQYKVMSIPTFMIFKNGEVCDTIMGAVPKENLINKINEYK